MASDENGRISKIEELLIKHDERMSSNEVQMKVLYRLIDQHDERMRVLENLSNQHDARMRIVERALENTERLLVLEGDRIDRLDLIESRQNELFAEISDQLHRL
jgi:hypothetical protein